MSVRPIGSRSDGTLLGEDENGQLYKGTPKLISLTEVTYDVQVSEDDKTIYVVETYDGVELSHCNYDRDTLIIFDANQRQFRAITDEEWEERKKKPESEPLINPGTGEEVKRQVITWEEI